ncbi:MAG: response regulator transcription factor [Bacteroides sp.]|nr:response regulator transcription factor [Roseburia sp.]MCM1345768.1 response regulator transcription factor [Bacteroides sp.]MCM1420137.1 response regulator transcription factor [Bacteroides sp.]
MKEAQTIKQSILFFESDQEAGERFYKGFIEDGYLCNWYTEAVSIPQIFAKNHYDICILNRQLSFSSGIELAHEIHSFSPHLPLIMLSPEYSVDNIDEAYKAGVDAYVPLSISHKELLLRIGAILHRTQKPVKKMITSIRLGKFVFTPATKQLVFNHESTTLTTKECSLLSLFCHFANEILPRSYTLTEIWSADTYFNARSMDVYISKLRKHLSKDPDIAIINIHGKGYRMIVPIIQTISTESGTK